MPLPRLVRYQALSSDREGSWQDGRMTDTLSHTRGIKKTTGPQTHSKAAQGTKPRPNSYSSAPDL